MVSSCLLLAALSSVVVDQGGRGPFAATRAGLRAELGRGDWEGVHARIRAGLGAALRASDAPAAARWRSELAVWALERHVFFREGRAAALAAAEEALRTDDADALAEAAHVLARLYYRDAFDTGDWARAQAQVEKARGLWLAAGRDDRLGDVHNYLGLVEFQQGRLDPAEAELRKALDLARGAGDENVASSVERHLGFVHQRRGARDAALEMFERSLRGREKLGATVTIPFAQIAVAETLLDSGREPERASSLLREAASLAASRSPRAEYTARRRLAKLALAAGQTAEARRELEAALLAAEAFGSASAVELIRADLEVMMPRE